MQSKSVTWVVLEEIFSRKRVGVISTHFWYANVNEEDNLQRLQNVEDLKNICDAIVKDYRVPIIVAGDFNNL